MQSEPSILKDDLTGLPNRHCFQDRLHCSISAAKRYSQRFAVMSLGIDDFHSINDHLGYHGGDELLMAVAKRLQDNFRGSDTIARLGSDEFVAIFQNISDTKNLNMIAQRFIDMFDEPFLIQDEKIYVNVSIGIACYPEDGACDQSLLSTAQQAMRSAKAHGKNHFKVYNEHMSEDNINYLMLSNDLHQAINKDEFILHYQPVIDGQNNQVIAVEALIRWQHPKLGLIGPGHFIHIAEKQGLILLISEWVIKQACSQLKTWQDTINADLMMSVNISAHLFEDPRLTDKIKSLIDECQIKPESLRLEITESTIMHHPDAAIKTLNDLHDLQLSLAVDDFGTGYSSLSYLKNFPVDTIKVDRSFVHDLETDHVNITIIKSILMLAEGLNMQAVIEGVETEAQKRILIENGVRYFQGYYFSKPLTVTDCETYILKQQSYNS